MMQNRDGWRVFLFALALAVFQFVAWPAGAQLPANAPLGERLYLTQCAMCHGPKGEGARGPTLARPKLLHAPDDDALRAVIRGGIAGTGNAGRLR